MTENKLISETEFAKWYVNYFTESLNEQLHTDRKSDLQNREPIIFKDYLSYLVESKRDGSKDYVIVDNINESIIYGSQSLESVACYIDVMRMNECMK